VCCGHIRLEVSLQSQAAAELVKGLAAGMLQQYHRCSLGARALLTLQLRCCCATPGQGATVIIGAIDYQEGQDVAAGLM
jgi:hypothetical protein